MVHKDEYCAQCTRERLRAQAARVTYQYAPFTRKQIEEALDHCKLEVQWYNRKFHTVRRNGKTQHWKSDPSRFRLPVKTGFKDCFAIGDNRAPNVTHNLGSPYLRIRVDN